MAFYAPNSGSVFAADGVIAKSACGMATWLFLVADEGAAASANINHGEVAASTMMILRAPTAGMSPVVGPLFTSTCFVVDGLEDGDVIALVRQKNYR